MRKSIAIIAAIVLAAAAVYALRQNLKARDNYRVMTKEVIYNVVNTPEQKAAMPRISAEYQSIYAAYDKLQNERPDMLELAVRRDVCSLYGRFVQYKELARRLKANNEDPLHYSRGPCSDCGTSFIVQLDRDVASAATDVGRLAYLLVKNNQPIICQSPTARAEILSMAKE
jgi:hypothetical protein